MTYIYSFFSHLHKNYTHKWVIYVVMFSHNNNKDLVYSYETVTPLPVLAYLYGYVFERVTQNQMSLNTLAPWSSPSFPISTLLQDFDPRASFKVNCLIPLETKMMCTSRTGLIFWCFVCACVWFLFCFGLFFIFVCLWFCLVGWFFFPLMDKTQKLNTNISVLKRYHTEPKMMCPVGGALPVYAIIVLAQSIVDTDHCTFRVTTISCSRTLTFAEIAKLTRWPPMTHRSCKKEETLNMINNLHFFFLFFN